MSQDDRLTVSRGHLMQILARKGTIYTLGLLMGILARLSMTDYQLYKEIETRAERARNDS